MGLAPKSMYGSGIKLLNKRPGSSAVRRVTIEVDIVGSSPASDYFLKLTGRKRESVTCRISMRTDSHKTLRTVGMLNPVRDNIEGKYPGGEGTKNEAFVTTACQEACREHGVFGVELESKSDDIRAEKQVKCLISVWCTCTVRLVSFVTFEEEGSVGSGH